MLKFLPVNLNDRVLVLHENGKCLGDLTKEADGYYKWWPNNDLNGYLPSIVLKEIASKLDELNSEWDAIVQKECSALSEEAHG